MHNSRCLYVLSICAVVQIARFAVASQSIVGLPYLLHQKLVAAGSVSSSRLLFQLLKNLLD